MADGKKRKLPWVLFWIRNQIYAIEAENILEMVVVPRIYSLPESPKHVRGVISLRDQIIPIIDLRTRMGIQPLGEELSVLTEMLHQRKEDHVCWIKELEQSLEERREFKLAVDPHQCAFGRWYDAFKTDSQALAFYLRKFEEPHRRIHQIALQVKKHQEAGQFKQARAVIEVSKGRDLKEMLSLFSGVGEALEESNREIALILTCGTNRYAISVDRVESVERLAQFDDWRPDHNSLLPDMSLIAMAAKRDTSDGIIQVLDVDKIIL